MLDSTQKAALFFIIALAARPALSASRPCFFGLAFLSHSADAPVPLIARTYGELMDSLGATVTPGTLAKMLENGDPFAIPEQEGTDLYLLRRKLAEFKRMLEAGKWNTEVVSGQLLELIAVKLAGANVAGERQAVVTAQSSRVAVIPLDEANHYNMVAPGSRWLISIDEAIGFSPHLAGRVVNLETGTVTPIRSPFPIQQDDAFYGRMSFSASKKEILLMTQNERFVSIPFENGVLNWSKSAWKGREVSLRTNAGPDADGRYAFGREDENAGKIYRQDLKTFERRTIEIPGIGIASEDHPTLGRVAGTRTTLQGYGQVPGSDLIWIYKRAEVPNRAVPGTAETRDYVETYELERKGMFSSKFVAVNPVVRLSKPAHSQVEVNWSAKGELLTLEGGKIQRWIDPYSPTEIFNVLTQKPTLNANSSWKSRTIQNGVYVELLREPFNTPTRWVRTIDLETGKVILETEAPSGSDSIQLTPDGSKLIFESRTSIHIMGHVPAQKP